MAIEATPIRDDGGGHRWELKSALRGYSGQRWYRVNTDNEALAIAAGGLPRLGDAWSTELEGCQVVGLSTERAGGQDTGTPGDGGWTWVRVTYEPISSVGGAGGDNPRATAHLDKWTEIRLNIESEPILRPVDDNGDTLPTGRPIRNGDGTTRLRGVCEFIVHVAYDTSVEIPDFAAFNSLLTPCHNNSEPVRFPPLYKMRDAVYQISNWEGLYKGYSTTVNGKYLEVLHTVQVASTAGGIFPFDEYWDVKDESGAFVETTASQLYPSASFAPLRFQ